jgi:hypothetical protein
MTESAHSEVQLERPSVARMYDYYLGGGHNFAVDREAAEKVIAVFPDMPLVMQANRGFLRRSVSFMIDQGIDQFLDVGSGIPTAGNVHEVAQRANPNAHIVYVDSDSVAVTYSEALLADNPRAAVIKADARNIDFVLNHPHVHRLLDFGKPLGVLIVALLHFIPDDDQAQQLTAALRAAMPAGSYMALTHGTTEGISAEARAQVERQYQSATSPFRYRSRSEIIPFFEGLSIIEPGIVFSPLWRPETSSDLFLEEPERSIAYAGVGRKD